MGKLQRSKRSREHKKQAKFAKLPKNTAHPSHLNTQDHKAMREYYEKINTD